MNKIDKAFLEEVALRLKAGEVLFHRMTKYALKLCLEHAKEYYFDTEGNIRAIKAELNNKG